MTKFNATKSYMSKKIQSIFWLNQKIQSKFNSKQDDFGSEYLNVHWYGFGFLTTSKLLRNYKKNYHLSSFGIVSEKIYEYLKMLMYFSFANYLPMWGWILFLYFPPK